jgi:hypothetical protein
MPQIGRYPDNMKISQLFEMMMDIRKGLHSGDLDEELIEEFGLRKIMDKTMRIIYTKNLPDIIEKKRTFLDLNNMYTIDHSRKIVYGRIAKKTIAASLDFK